MQLYEFKKMVNAMTDIDECSEIKIRLCKNGDFQQNTDAKITGVIYSVADGVLGVFGKRASRDVVLVCEPTETEGAKVIEEPEDKIEAFILETLRRLAELDVSTGRAMGIGFDLSRRISKEASKCSDRSPKVIFRLIPEEKPEEE